MKRILCTLLCAFEILCLCACSGQKTERSEAAPSSSLSSDTSPDTSAEPDIPEVSHTSGESEQPSEQSPEPSADPAEDFERIPKLSEAPDYITSNPRLYASMLENIIKLYYSGIVSGRVNSEAVTLRYSEDKLPAADADPETRRTVAKYCTVGGALEYFGYDNADYMKYLRMFNGCLPYFCYDSDANIFAVSENPKHAVLNMTGFDQTLYFIFRSADKSAVERDAQAFAAAETDNAVKNYYAGIRNGSINSSVKLPHSSDILPDKNASQDERDRLAADATIAGALDYAASYTPICPLVELLGYNSKTGSITMMDHTEHAVLAIPSADMKLGTLSP